jgi:DNA polymerase
LSDELRRRYLRQQAELGGAEMVTSGRPAAAPAAAPQAAEATAFAEDQSANPPARPAGDAADVGSQMPANQQPAAGAGKWRKGAPPIPGSGLEALPGIVPGVLEGMGSLDALAEYIRAHQCCQTLCPLRKNAVPGEGDPKARLMLVGEGPGQTEDETGRPFVGAAGNLLNGILEAIELTREQVFIANVVKCRPPGNRKPLPDEVQSCIPYLWRQIDLIRPKVILTLGGTAAEALLGVKKSLGELRGKVHSYGGIPLVATYHPAALLRNPNWKKPTWDDVRIARQLLDR